jgi:hypothetical protein
MAQSNPKKDPPTEEVREHVAAKQGLVAAGAGMPAWMIEQMDGEGRGVSTDAADNIVPRISLLDPKSPQVSRHDPENYVDGAEPGDLWLQGAPHPIVKGDKGLLFQPCWFGKCVIEWIVRNPDGSGGGFVARHKAMPSDAKETPDPNTKPGERPKMWWMSPRGTQYVETREHAGFAITEDGPLPYVLSFKSTGHQVSKEWQGMFKRPDRMLPTGKYADSFVVIYRLTSWLRKRGAQSWFQLEVHEAGPDRKPLWATVEQVRMGRALYDAFESGAKQAAVPDADEPGAQPEGKGADQIPF